MPVVPTKEIVDRAFEERYGVAAINVVNDLTMEAVLAAAEELRAPADRPDVGQDREVDRRRRAVRHVDGRWPPPSTVPVALHLDHCPERDVISLCLAKGWNSVLFDGSQPQRRGEQAPVRRGGGRGPRVRGAGRGRDRGLQAGRGHRRRRASNRAVARDRDRLHHLDRRRRLRPGHRQRPRDVPERRPSSTASASPTSSRPPASRWRSTAAPG